MKKYQQQNRQIIEELLSFYHVEQEAPDDDDLCNIQITEIEGEREVEGPSLASEVFVAPIKVKKSKYWDQ